jgi:hypothetical protein
MITKFLATTDPEKFVQLSTYYFIGDEKDDRGYYMKVCVAYGEHPTEDLDKKGRPRRDAGGIKHHANTENKHPVSEPITILLQKERRDSKSLAKFWDKPKNHKTYSQPLITQLCDKYNLELKPYPKKPKPSPVESSPSQTPNLP